jgi:microcystin-dependent protein
MKSTLIVASISVIAISAAFSTRASPEQTASSGGTDQAQRQEPKPLLGEIKLVPYSFAPKGWADCNGQLLPIGQNKALFSLLGTTFGGDGITTFALPDLRSRVPVHFGKGPSLQPVKLGEYGDEIRINAAEGATESTRAFLGLRFIIAIEGDFPPVEPFRNFR